MSDFVDSLLSAIKEKAADNYERVPLVMLKDAAAVRGVHERGMTQCDFFAKRRKDWEDDMAKFHKAYWSEMEEALKDYGFEKKDYEGLHIENGVVFGCKKGGTSK